MDYISRSAAIETVSKWLSGVFGIRFEDGAATIFKKLRSIPAADVVERASGIIGEIPSVELREVKRGKWKQVVDFTGVEAFGYKETTLVGYGCNVCGYEVDVSDGDFHFCPNCGADMRGTDDV